MNIETGTTLGEIAAHGPNARGVLLRHRLDFCCRGQRTLTDACTQADIDRNEVVDDLKQAEHIADERDWEVAPLSDIVEHILTRYHAPLPAQLASVVAAAEKVERVHGKKPSCPNGLADNLRSMSSEMASHMDKEEKMLFPEIVNGRRGAMLNGPIVVMMTEHEDHGINLLRNRELTNDLVPPPEACATWRALYEQLEQLESDLMEHIHLENHVLFPRALKA